MADYTRSKSNAYGYGGSSCSAYNDMQMQPYSAAGQLPPPQSRHCDLTPRCYYSTSYAQAQMDIWGGGSGGGSCGQGSYYGGNNLGGDLNDFKLKKGKGFGGSWSGSKSAWAVIDPELERKKRVASYKMYAVEGKVKGSFRKSFRWLKDRYSQVFHGWW